MIDKFAVEKYLRKDFDSHVWLKSLSEKELNQIIAEMKPRPQITFPLRKHQKVCFILGVAYPGFYFRIDMGGGKTMLMLALMDYFLDIGLVEKVLVLTRTDQGADNWEEQIQEWCPDLPYILLKGASVNKWQDFEDFERGLAIVSYPGLVHMCCVKELIKHKGKKARQGLVPKRELVDRLLKYLDAFIGDEITRAMNSESLTFRICNQISKAVKYHYGLAGRAFGRDPLVVWAQFMLTDRGETFGSTLGFFREVFFDAKQNPWGGKYAKDYTFKKSMDADFGRIMNHRSIGYDTEETDIILPPVVAARKYVDLPPSSMEYYRRTLEELKRSRGNVREVQNKFIRLRQISSGFIGFYDDDNGEKAQLEFRENPKLDLLMDLVENIPEDRKFVICVCFTWSGAKISQELRKLKMDHGWLYSGTKNWPAMKKRFDNDPEFRGLIVQAQMASYELNLQSANYPLIYESPLSVMDREQFERRCRRDGQKHTVFQYDLIMRNTVDQTILSYHTEGRSLYRDLVKNPEAALRGEL